MQRSYLFSKSPAKVVPLSLLVWLECCFSPPQPIRVCVSVLPLLLLSPYLSRCTVPHCTPVSLFLFVLLTTVAVYSKCNLLRWHVSCTMHAFLSPSTLLMCNYRHPYARKSTLFLPRLVFSQTPTVAAATFWPLGMETVTFLSSTSWNTSFLLFTLLLLGTASWQNNKPRTHLLEWTPYRPRALLRQQEVSSISSPPTSGRILTCVTIVSTRL